MLPKRPIRVATLGDWSRYFSYFLAGTQEGAILNGCWFRPIDIRANWNRIRKNLAEFRPDILFCHMIFSEGIHNPEKNIRELENLRRKYATKIYYHLGDARTEPRWPHEIRGAVDGCLVNQTGSLQKFSRIWKVPCYYWPYGCFQQKRIADIVPEFEHMLVFTGRLSDKGIHGHRTRFIAELQQLMPVKVYPNDKYPDTKLLTADIAASAHAVLGVCAGYEIPGYMDVRPFQYPGAGAFLMQRKYNQMERVFVANEHMMVFDKDDPQEFVQWYKWWMSHPKKVEHVRNKGFEFCQKYHTVRRRVKDVINIAFGKSTKTRVFLEDVL